MERGSRQRQEAVDIGHVSTVAMVNILSMATGGAEGDLVYLISSESPCVAGSADERSLTT
jgi:hypothetical protein